ncbi:MAG: hypothetical protein K0S04_614 [Herbinix sp.]|jgi:chromate transporter|nr:hypothetical protein [Herbinix sp.]
MKKLISLLLSFLKIGFIGFGGGSALIPIVEEEVVANKKLLKENDYNDHVIVANITPGTLPVKLAAAAGRKVSGIPGMIGAAIMVSLPGVAITVVMISIMSQLNDHVLEQIKYASIGISIFIILLLVNYINKVFKGCKESNILSPSWMIMLLVFFLTAGKEIYSIFEIDMTPIFDISTINILLLSFFIIFSCSGKITYMKASVIGVISIIFILCTGKSQIISNVIIFDIIKLIMLLFTCYSVYRSIKKSGKMKKIPVSGLVSELVVWAVLFLICSIPAVIAIQGVFGYLGNGLLSSVISFGGGEAYLTIADSMFVSAGTISSEIFYGQILPVANALPGPILSKVLAGIGYIIGFNATESVATGYLLAIGGYAASLAASCGVFFFINYVYNCFESLDIFKTLKKWILPIVCGLLLSTIVSMMTENFKIILEQNMSRTAALLICTGIFGVLYLLHKKFHLHDVILIIISGVASLTICNII